MSSDNSSHSYLQIGKLSVTIILGDAESRIRRPRSRASIGEQFHLKQIPEVDLARKTIDEFQHKGIWFTNSKTM